MTVNIVADTLERAKKAKYDIATPSTHETCGHTHRAHAMDGMRCAYACGVHMHAVCICMRCAYACGVHMHAVCICMRCAYAAFMQRTPSAPILTGVKNAQF